MRCRFQEAILRLHPTQVIVFDTTGGTGTTLPIAGATAADFSPDSLKAFIAAGSSLYVYSTQDALKKIPLTAPASAVSFSPEGAFAFVAGGSTTSSVTAWSTCGLTSGLTNNVVLPAPPSFLQALGRDAVNLARPADLQHRDYNYQQSWRWIRRASTFSACPGRRKAVPRPQAAVPRRPLIWARAALCPPS